MFDWYTIHTIPYDLVNQPLSCACSLCSVCKVYSVKTDCLVIMDIAQQSPVYLMPLTQLILVFVFGCVLLKVAAMRLFGGAATAAGQPKRGKETISTVKRAPQPRGIPILGNVLSMAGYELPYQAFGALGKRYGPIISLQMGNQPAMVVNGIEHIKEVLIAKSAHFDSRPNFKRYHDLFSGNKENCKCGHIECKLLYILYLYINISVLCKFSSHPMQHSHSAIGLICTRCAAICSFSTRFRATSPPAMRN